MISPGLSKIGPTYPDKEARPSHLLRHSQKVSHEDQAGNQHERDESWSLPIAAKTLSAKTKTKSGMLPESPEVDQLITRSAHLGFVVYSLTGWHPSDAFCRRARTH